MNEKTRDFAKKRINPWFDDYPTNWLILPRNLRDVALNYRQVCKVRFGFSLSTPTNVSNGALIKLQITKRMTMKTERRLPFVSFYHFSNTNLDITRLVLLAKNIQLAFCLTWETPASRLLWQQYVFCIQHEKKPAFSLGAILGELSLWRHYCSAACVIFTMQLTSLA